MRTIKIVALILFLFISATYGMDEERSGGFTSTKMKMQTALQQLQSKQPDPAALGFGDTTYKTLSRLKTNLSTQYFDKTLMTDYTKSKVMEMLSQLAITSAFSIGTAGQTEQGNIISNASDSLSGSSDPEYQKIGQLFDSLAESISEGNEVTAKSIAAQIQEYVDEAAPEIAAGYQPTKEENSLLAGLAGVLSNSMGRILGMLSSFGMAMLFKTLGFGALASNPIGLGISIILQETLGAVFTGVTGGGEVNWQPVESAVVNQSTGLTEQGASVVEDNIKTTLDEAAGPNTDTVAVNGKTEAGGESSSPATK